MFGCMQHIKKNKIQVGEYDKRCSVTILRLKSFNMKQSSWRTAYEGTQIYAYMYSVHHYTVEMMCDVVRCYVQPLFHLIITLPVEVVLYSMRYRETGLNCLTCGFFHSYYIFWLEIWVSFLYFGLCRFGLEVKFFFGNILKSLNLFANRNHLSFD